MFSCAGRFPSVEARRGPARHCAKWGAVKQAHHVFAACVSALLSSAMAADIALPPRAVDAPRGGAFAARIADLPLAAREREVREEVARGNVPDFWRRFV